MHARPKNSSYGNRGGPREAIEAKKGVVESHTDGASAAPTFLSLHRLHLTYTAFSTHEGRLTAPAEGFLSNIGLPRLPTKLYLDQDNYDNVIKVKDFSIERAVVPGLLLCSK